MTRDEAIAYWLEVHKERMRERARARSRSYQANLGPEVKRQRARQEYWRNVDKSRAEYRSWYERNVHHQRYRDRRRYAAASPDELKFKNDQRKLRETKIAEVATRGFARFTLAEDEQLIALVADGLSSPAIALLMGRSVKGVRKRKKRLRGMGVEIPTHSVAGT